MRASVSRKKQRSFRASAPIIEERKLRRYFRLDSFDRLIQGVAVAGGAAPRFLLRFDARQQVAHPADQEILALRFRPDFEQRLLFVEFDGEAAGQLVRK